MVRIVLFSPFFLLMGILMKKNKKDHMSFWGIGPIFVVVTLFIVLIASIFSFKYSDIFIFNFIPVLFYIFGAILIIFGLYLWISAGKQIDRCILKGVLATKGTYGIVRNPIYSGFLIVLCGIFLIIQSWMLFSLLPFIYIFLRVLLRKEDSLLTETFGKEYLEYKNSVNIVFPRFSKIYKAFFYPVETQKIGNSLFAVKSKDTNFFIYKSENSYICFDTGYGKNRTLEELEKLNIKPEDIKTVFLTHSDPDHTKGLRLFDNSKIYIGKDEEPLITGRKFRVGFFYKNPKIKKDYTLLENNQIITIDNTKIETIATPGHTIGHLSYKINDEIIISGDSVIYQNGFIKPFYFIYNMNKKKAFDSAKKMEKFEGSKIICTAHTGVVSI